MGQRSTCVHTQILCVWCHLRIFIFFQDLTSPGHMIISVTGHDKRPFIWEVVWIKLLQLKLVRLTHDLWWCQLSCYIWVSAKRANERGNVCYRVAERRRRAAVRLHVFIVLFSSVAANKESSQQEVEKRSFTINKALLADLATSHHTRIHGDYIYAISCRVCTKAVIWQAALLHMIKTRYYVRIHKKAKQHVISHLKKIQLQQNSILCSIWYMENTKVSNYEVTFSDNKKMRTRFSTVDHSRGKRKNSQSSCSVWTPVSVCTTENCITKRASWLQLTTAFKMGASHVPF